MYPIEFGNIFGGNDTQMHASEELTGEVVEELTGEVIVVEEMTGETDTGTTIENDMF